MKLSRTAIKELTAKYRAVLLKCAILNMAAFAIAIPSAHAESVNTFDGLASAIRGTGTDLRLSNNLAVGDHHPDYDVNITTLEVNQSSLTISADYGNTITGQNTWSYDPTRTGNSVGITVGAERTLTLNGLRFTGFSGSDVINYGTFNANAVTLNEGVTGTGRMIVGVAPNDNSVSTISSITQNNLTINNGATLAISADGLSITNTIQNNGTLALSAGTLGQNIANANLVTTTGAVTLSGNLTGAGSVTVGNGSSLTFKGANNSNAISGVGTGALQIGDGTNATTLTTTGALNIATTINNNAQLTAAANLIQGSTTNSGVLTLTAGTLTGTVTNNATGTLNLAGVTATADITNTTGGEAANMVMTGNVTLISLLGAGKAQLYARTVDTTLTLKGIRNENDISADTTGGNRTAKIIVDNDGVTHANNALTTTGKLLADTTINAGAAMIADADKLGAPGEGNSITVTNNGKLALNGGEDATHVKTGHADIANAGSITVKNHAGISGKLTGNGTVLLDANETDAYLTLNGTKNENTINREVGEGHTAGIVIQNEGVGNAAANAKSLVSTAALNADIEIADANTRVVTAANLLGRDLATGSMIVTNKGELVLDGGTLKQHIQGYQENMTTPYYGKTILRQSVEVAGGVELSNKLIVGDETPGLTTPDKELSGAGSVTAMDNTIVYTNGEISVKSLTVNNQNTLEEALGIGIGFLNRGTVSSKELTIGAEDGERYSVFNNTANGAKITTAKAGTENESLTITGLGVLKTAGTNTEAETINNNGYLLLTGATQNAVVGDVNTAVEGHPYFGTTINKAGASTITTLEQGTVTVEAGSLTVTGNATATDVNVKHDASATAMTVNGNATIANVAVENTGTLTINGTAAIATLIDVDEGAALNLTGTTGETAPMEIAAATVKNDGTINTTGKVLFKGNVSHDAAKGTIALADDAELTLAGPGNSSTITGSAHNAAKLIIKNGEGVAQLINQGTLLVDTDIKSGSDMSSAADYIGKNEAEVITRIDVTNDGRLALKNWTDADGNTKTAYANIVNNNTDMNGLIISSTDTRRVVVDGNIVNNGRIDASGKATIKGNLTGSIPGATEADPAQPGMVALSDNTELVLNGTNSNTIRANAHDAAHLFFDNDEMKLNTGKLLVDTEITDGSTVRSGANFLGAAATTDPVADAITINVTNNGTLELTGVGEEKTAYANINNVAEADLMNVTGTVRLNGNLTGLGTTTLIANDAVGNASLTLAGTSNTNTIAADITGEHTANLFITNTGVIDMETPANTTALTNEGKLLVDTTITATTGENPVKSRLITAAGNLGDDTHTITVTNNGSLDLTAGTAYANIKNAEDIAVTGAVILNGNLEGVTTTGETPEIEIDDGQVTLANGAVLTLKGTKNTNTIQNDPNVEDSAGTLEISNLGATEEHEADALTNTGILLTNTSILANSKMITDADLLGAAATTDPVADEIKITLTNANTGILALAGAGSDQDALVAHANIANAGSIEATGKIRLEGNLTGAGTTTLDATSRDTTLTLAGTSNTNTIVAVVPAEGEEQHTANLFVTNTGNFSDVPAENTALNNEGRLLADTTITATVNEGVTTKSGMKTSAGLLGLFNNNGTPDDPADDTLVQINMTNHGNLKLTAGEAYANIANDSDIDVTGAVILNGNLTGVTTGEGEGAVTNHGTVKVKASDALGNASLTLKGTKNTNTIVADITGEHTAILNVVNTGVIEAEDPAAVTALTNEGNLRIDTTIAANSAMVTAANLLGAEGDGNTIGVTNNGTLVLNGGADAENIQTAYADIMSFAGTTATQGHIRLEGNLAGPGTGIVNNSGVLTLAGTRNNQTIGGTGSLIVDNTGDYTNETPELRTALLNGGALNQAVTVNPGAALVTSADHLGTELAPITVTNKGTVVLDAGTLYSAINPEGDAANIVIDGNVASNVALAKATINATKQLTIAAEHVGAFNNAGTVQLRAGNTATFSSALTTGAVKLMDNLTFANGASFGNADSKADLNLNGKTLDIGTNTLTIGTLTGGDASTIKLTLLENATDATLVSTTTANVENVLLDINTAAVSKLDVQHYKVTNAETTGYNVHLSGNPYNYVVSENPFDMEDALEMARGEAFNFNNWQNHDLYILKVEAVARVAAEKLIESGIGVSQNEQGAVATLADDDVYNAMTVGQKASVDRINNMLAIALDSNNEGQAKQILKEVGAEKAPAVAQSEAANVGAVMNVVGSRLGGAAPAPAAAGADHGRSGGSEFFVGKTAVWGQMMFNTAKLDRTDGFDSDSAGFALGAEYKINDEYKVGFGYAFTTTDLKTDRSKTDVDTHTGFLYGEYKPNNFYVNGVLSFGTSSYDEKTKLTNITADYDATTFGIQAMAGYTFGIITPEAGLRYTNVKQDAYTNSLGVRAGSKTNEMLTAIAGAKYAQAFRVGNDFILTPEARVAMTYDIDRSKQDRSITLANGAGYISEGQNMDRFGLELGAGVSFKVNNAIDIGVSYEGKFKKDYSDHTGLLNVKYNF